jgi:phenylacetaldehyde dehydrogenase
MLVGDDWTQAVAGETFDVFDPGRARVIATVASGRGEDVDAAVRAARESFESGVWRQRPGQWRAEVLWRIADAVQANAQALARMESINQGMPLKSALSTVGTVVRVFRYYAGWVEKINGHSGDLRLEGRRLHTHTRNDPVGVAGLIIPWNAPLEMAAWKLAPALAAGCSCVLKPAEETPLTALCLAELLLGSGVPAGVVNVVTGLGPTAGAALAAHPDVDKVAFTGSTEVGRAIIAASVGNLKKVSLELGGKSPVIIFEDADLEAASAGAAWSILGRTGQSCTAGSRLFIQESVYDQVVSNLLDVMKSVQIGYSLDPDSEIGPLISQRQLRTVEHYVQLARDEGAEVERVGNIPTEGYFAQPTVLSNVTADMTPVREEIFGPVVAAAPFKDDSQALAVANESSYGLAAWVWTRDVARALRMTESLRAGRVGVNVRGIADVTMPTGGFKQSGWGRELGPEGLELFLEKKSVFISY